jgi:GNAT superfamily N-acetyltransferase
MPECVAVLRRVHEVNAYPARWPQDAAGWITPAGLQAAWVAVHDDSTVGHVAVVKGMNANCLLHATGRDAGELGGIVRLFVDPPARRAGCARELLEAATSYAVAQGLQPVLDVVDDGLAAIALYEGAGWRLVGAELATWVTPAGVRPKVRWYVLPLRRLPLRHPGRHRIGRPFPLRTGPSLARPDRPPGGEWAVRPTPAGSVGPSGLCRYAPAGRRLGLLLRDLGGDPGTPPARRGPEG